MSSNPKNQSANNSKIRTYSVVLSSYNTILRQKKQLDHAFEKHFFTLFHSNNNQEKHFCYALLLMLIRRQRQYQQIIKKFLQKPLNPKNSYVSDVLLLGCCELIHFSTPAYATINTLVNIIKKSQFKHFASLVNAILREIERQKPSLYKFTLQTDIILPPNLYNRYKKIYGQDTAKRIAEIYLKPPHKDLTFIKTPNKTTIEKLNAYQLPTQSVRLYNINEKINTLPGYASGDFFVQNSASHLVGLLLPHNLSNKTVIDIGAAPGGKTMHLATKNATVIAIDKNIKRLKILEDNLTRTKLDKNVTIICEDLITWQKTHHTLYDYVIVDAPCSATGTLRKNPELPWIKDTIDFQRYQQKDILNSASCLVKKNGYIIYSVCSIEPEEGEDRIDDFLTSHKNFRLFSIEPHEIGHQKHFINNKGCLRILPFMNFKEHKNNIIDTDNTSILEGLDGFFIARLKKIS